MTMNPPQNYVFFPNAQNFTLTNCQFMEVIGFKYDPSDHVNNWFTDTQQCRLA